MGRAPCCDKANVKRGPWSPEEDAKLKSYIENNGTGGNWIALPQKIGLKRCGKSCRLRWLNYLRPNIKHGGFSEEEDNIICSLYVSIGSRWSVIAAQLPGRTDNDIKNYWNTRLKKKLLGKHRKEQQPRRGNSFKQEANRGSANSLPPENTTQHQPYWPHMPVLNQGPSFNDQDSIRKLLIKLGGRFSDDYQPTLDGTPSTQKIYQQEVDMASSACMNTINNNQGQFPQGNFTAPLEEIAPTYPQGLDGLEFLYGEDMVNYDNIGPSCSQSSDWGETSSLIYPPLAASNYHETPKECAFQELRYPGA